MKLHQNNNTFRLLLLLPSDWIPQLDALAKSRYTSRLGLIRQLLRLQMDQEFAQLAAHFEKKERQSRTVEDLNCFFNDNEY